MYMIITILMMIMMMMIIIIINPGHKSQDSKNYKLLLWMIINEETVMQRNVIKALHHHIRWNKKRTLTVIARYSLAMRLPRSPTSS